MLITININDGEFSDSLSLAFFMHAFWQYILLARSQYSNKKKRRVVRNSKLRSSRFREKIRLLVRSVPDQFSVVYIKETAHECYTLT